MEDLFKQFPPASENNAREIIRREIDKFKANPSERRAMKIEALTGWDIDWKDSDFGEGPRGFSN